MNGTSATSWRAWDDMAGTPRECELAASLIGLPVPSVQLASTAGETIDLASLAAEPLVIYLYPGTETMPARAQDPDGLLRTSCTVQSQAFGEYAMDLGEWGVRVLGVSSRTVEEQRRFAARERLPFSLASDVTLELASALGLPTSITPSGDRVYKRMTLLASEGTIEWVFDPVPIPRRNAIDVLEWVMGKSPGFEEELEEELFTGWGRDLAAVPAELRF
jgi:peroxiredoxin